MTEVKLHELAPQRLSIQCSSSDGCGTLTRVYRQTPQRETGAFKYCPVCGNDSIMAYMSADEDQWEALSRDFELPIPILQMLYEAWRQDTKYQHFGSYINAVKEQATKKITVGSN